MFVPTYQYIYLKHLHSNPGVNLGDLFILSPLNYYFDVNCLTFSQRLKLRRLFIEISDVLIKHKKIIIYYSNNKNQKFSRDYQWGLKLPVESFI